MNHRLPIRPFAATLVAALATALVGCEMIERAEPKARTTRSNQNFELDVEPILRGTIASETVLVGFEPTVVRGYGLVVGLKATGSRLVPAEVRTQMIREMARRGIGNHAYGAGDLSPERMLDSDDTAVVVVEGVIPAGSPKDATFDVRVAAIPGSGTTSLEGGRLYTTDLRPGPLRTGSRQSFPLAEAGGPIFINPFIEPDATGSDAVNRTTGRILGGGKTTDDMPLRIRLAMTSHARAASIEAAINSMFPREPGQLGDTAQGRSGDTVDLTIPPSWRDRPEEFVQLVRHTPLRITAPEQTAYRVKRSLLAAPAQGETATWRWRAIGPKAVPVFQDLYDHPEDGPRFAAIEAGAHLDDPLVVPALVEMATVGGSTTRLRAIELLAGFGLDPRIDLALRPLLDDTDVDIRLAAFDCLEERQDPIVGRFSIDGKFDLMVVPSDEPMVYVTQSGDPTLVVFGDRTEIGRPLVFSAWSNRLMVRGEADRDDLSVYYRRSTDEPPVILDAPTSLPEFVAFLAHGRTPESPLPGLGLTYSETIGALHSMWREEAFEGGFKAEQDRILAAIMRASEGEEIEERPEFEEEPLPEEFEFLRPGGDAPAGGVPGTTRGSSAGSGLAGLAPPVEAAVPRGDTVPR
ncbi:MAG: flagellar basal body P-ring protein FlgI [Phycisphaerales bacterium]